MSVATAPRATTASRRARRAPRATQEGERPSARSRVLAGVVMVVVALYFLVPIYWLVVASTKSTADLFGTPGFWFADMQLVQNLVDLSTYDGGIFWRWMLNSLVYSGLGSVLMTLVSLALGYALAIYRFRGRAFVIALVLGSMLVPQTVLAQPIYQLLVEIGLNNTMLGVLLPTIAYPFGVLLAFTYAQASVPQEIVEAARLDGAGEVRTFFSIGLRMLSTGGVTILLFAFIASWNSFMLPLLVLSDTRLQPVTVGLSGWSQAAITVPGLQTLVVVGALLSVIPIIAVFLSLQRFWKSGLSAGAVKM
ncbi:carbohydrate ABC transporter permease [Cellulomonas sp. C5510]|uniref:carbohydrate ABC transporter permease n=1 Tax=Cellulomonas sp. C5510 TaxID=2871170 RepID=UPI001C983888|nr:carbohydrate ABC transporter permease [Cellulomonas sp. C5510]QZN85442.1 carbohydrate ABC transporter permease [Cellulomonas sp. C5510]